MKTQISKEYWNRRVLQLPIYYKPDATIRKRPTDKLEYLKVNIKTQLGERDSDMVAISVPPFRTWSPEALLNFFNILHKIIRGQDLSMGTQKFGMIQNLIVRDALWVFKQKVWERGTEKNTNYELVTNGLIYHFFPPKLIQHQKRYLRRRL